MTQVKVKFLEDYTVKDGTDDPDRYEKGKTYLLENEASALHFIRRRVAEYVDPPRTQPKSQPKAQPVAEEDKPPPPPKK